MKHITGDLLDSPLKHIVHGCNAQGKMGSGIAKTVKERYPLAYDAYLLGLRKDAAEGYDLLGKDYPWYDSKTGRTIHNLITQINYGKDGKKYAYYSAIAGGLVDIAAVISDQGILSFIESPGLDKVCLGIPLIGCSLGGLKWEFMETLLLEIEEIAPIEFWVYSL